MKNAFRKMVLVAGSTAALAMAPGAKADGFLGGLINQVAPGVGTALDQANKSLGYPTERIVATGADQVVPGAGAVLQMGWALQREQGAQREWPGQPAMQTQYNGPAPAPALGNMCATPMGRFGPGPVAPLGSPCQAYSPYGIVMGAIAM